MTVRANQPTIIHALEPKAHIVRQVALELGVLYEEAPAFEREGVIRFSFNQMDESAIRRLVAAMPIEIYASRAMVGPQSDAGCGDSGCGRMR